MKPTLLILAAGMGSRYGGLKQIDGIGPNKEPIIEYSIYDAIKAGFGKIVFVIRKEFDTPFRKIFDSFNDRIKIQYVYQPVNLKGNGLNLVAREKPWGTSHAVLVAKNVIKEPFAVINADDFYGENSFKKMANFLITECSPSKMSMIGYILENTLSKNGSVNRGVCKLDHKQNLIEVVERIKIKSLNGTIKYNVGSNSPIGKLNPKSYVSMNYWGFHPAIFKSIEAGLRNFMKQNANSPSAEYYIPSLVTSKINSKEITFSVIPTTGKWFGVTYKEDKNMAIDAIKQQISEGVYPRKLWN